MTLRHPLLVRSSLVAMTTLLVGLPAHAQTLSVAAANAQATTATSDAGDRRPSTPTFLGDTGIWYVPTAEVLPRHTWSIGGDRRGTNYVQGSSNVADFAGTAAFGVSDRVEVFGAFLADTRINRNDGPIFADRARDGGVISRYPRVSESWTGDSVGDLYLGTKVNLASQYRRSPVAFALRGIVKLPTGDEAAGNSTGKVDALADLIASGEAKRFFELATYGGFEVRGKPAGLEEPGGSFRWGMGASFPSRSPLRISAEANGDLPTNRRATLTDRTISGDDGTLPPFMSDSKNRARTTAGLTYQTRAGVFMGTGVSWNMPRYWDWQFRVGYQGRSHQQPRARAVVTPSVVSAPLPVATPTPPVVAVAPPAPPAQRAAPVVAVAAAQAAPANFAFEDVYFALDGYTPNAAALAILDVAVTTLNANPSVQIAIDGHTCFLGTAEYNIALGERRATAVMDYLVSRGVSAGRMRTASYGEENPAHDNATEESRRLNRRVALVVRLQP
jgi:peptidoglycan-associated lipoprotein